MEDVDLVLKRPSTFPHAIVDFIVVDIKVVKVKEVGIGIKIPSTVTLTILYQVFMVMGEVYIGIRTSSLPPITELGVINFWVSHFLLVLLKKNSMLMRDVDTGIRSETLPPINQVGVVDCCSALLLHVLLTKVFMVIIGVI